MSSSETEGRSARVDVGKVVVSVRNSDLQVLSLVRVRVANEGSLPVIVQLAVGNGDTSATVSDIE